MFAKLYAVALPVFFAIDMVWLGLIAKDFYAKQIGFLMRSPPNWSAAVIFYLLFIGGLVAFVISPAIDKGQWQYAFGMGLFFGLVTYATYDLTSLAVIKDWPLRVTIIDMIWGAVLASSVSTITYLIAAKFIVK
jgi:uncharacterized membrane protein